MMKLSKRLMKPKSKDFDESMLPRTRFKQFFDIFRIRYLSILGIGVLLFCFFIPTFISISVRDSFIASANREFTGDELAASIASIYLIFAIIDIPCLMIFSLGFAGSIKVLYRLVFGEPLFFKDDFLLGIKENFKHYLLISFVLGLFNLFAVSARFYLANMEILSYVPMAIDFAVIYPIIYCFFFVDAMYSNPVFRNMKLSIKVFVRSLLSTLAICIFFYAGLFMRYIPYYYIKYICVIILIIFVFPIILLAASENEVRVFDKFINPNYFKEYVNKGLYRPQVNKDESLEGSKND